MFVLIGQAIASLVLYAMLGQGFTDPGSVSRLLGAALPFINWIVVLPWKLVSVPPLMHSEQQAEIGLLQSALSDATEAPDMVLIDGLIRRDLDKLSSLLRTLPVHMPGLVTHARDMIEDLKMIFGLEYGEGFERRLYRGFDGQTALDMRLAAFLSFETELDIIRPNFHAGMVTRETPNLNAYVMKRLAELRGQA